MADQHVMMAINKLKATRAQHLIDILDATRTDAATLPETLVDVLTELATSWRAEADLWTKSKTKGWQSISTRVRESAAMLQGVIGQAVAIRDTTPIAEAEAQAINIAVEPTEPTEPVPATFPSFDLSPIPSDVGDAVQAAIIAEAETQAINTAVAADFEQKQAGDREAIRAYINGDTDDLFTDPPRYLEGTPEYDKYAAELKDALADPAAWNVPKSSGSLPAGNIGDTIKAEMMNDSVDPFIDPPKLSAGYSNGGGYAPSPRLSYVDISDGARRTLPPDHRSFSQIETYEDCGLKYLMQRRMTDVVQLPQWALIGGKAFHACAEEIERARALSVDFGVEYVELLWKEHFTREITEVAVSTGIAMDRWRASSKGAEGYTWWMVHGPEMVQRYLDMPNLGDIINVAPGATEFVPVIEYAHTLDVNGVPVKMVIDQARVRADGSIVVIDLKSGAGKPNDTFQLALYAWALRSMGIGRGDTPIHGAYYDARKGTYTDVPNLLERHPWPEVVYRVTTMDRAERAGNYLPRRSSFCGGCSVKHACPAMKD